MEIAIGIDVHKEKCTAFAKFAGKGEPRPRHEEFLERFNERFRRFDSDYRGMTELAGFVRDHSVHVLSENSTKSQDVYWMLRGLGLEVTVAHATDLKQITESMNKNDDNDAAKLAGYMRRRLGGETEFAQCYIPMQETLLQRELCRYGLRLRSELTALKCQIHAHMLIRGWKLTRDYTNIVSTAALRELNAADIDIFRFDAAKAKYLKQLISETDRALRVRMGTNRMFESIWSIPGFGILSASYMTCMIDDLSRFKNGKSLAAWMGLTPRLDESADKPKNCGITRRGDPELRKLICQATFVHIFHSESFISEKYRRLKSEGKSHNEALVACANSMAQMIFAMLRDGTKYVSDSETLAEARALADSEEIEDEMEASARA